MNQYDRRAGPDVEIRDSLIMDENGLDRDAFDRAAFQRFKIGWNLHGWSAGGHQVRDEAETEQGKSPVSAWAKNRVGDEITPAE